MSAAVFDAFASSTPATTDLSRSIDYHDFALIWPICGVIDQSRSNRIVSYVVPFFCVAFVAALYVIKEPRLPEPLPHQGH